MATPLARLASSAASLPLAPEASASMKTAIAVSPAPETSKTARAQVGVPRAGRIAKEHHAVLAERDEEVAGGFRAPLSVRLPRQNSCEDHYIVDAADLE
jgi:hypothetical protein